MFFVKSFDTYSTLNLFYFILVHPCKQVSESGKPTNGGCQQICTEVGTEALCECKEGYTVDENDKKACRKRMFIEFTLFH